MFMMMARYRYLSGSVTVLLWSMIVRKAVYAPPELTLTPTQSKNVIQFWNKHGQLMVKLIAN